MNTVEMLGIPCPKCGVIGQQRVVDSRPCKGYIWRRRQCLNCNTRFRTYETGGEGFAKIRTSRNK